MNYRLLSHLYLIKTFTIREIQNRYKGSLLGILWALITPILMLLVFSFVFGEIFQAKWPGNTGTNKIDFAINLFIGLSIFWYFADILAKSPTIISSVPNYVKKVIFPLEILPLVTILSTLVYLIINFIIIFITILITSNHISITIISIPLLIVITIPLLLGISLLLSAIGVYAKDIGVIIGVFINLLMFLSPIFYPISAIPEKMIWLFNLNPLTAIIEESRKVLLYNSWPDWNIVFVYTIISLLVYYVGNKIFKITKKGFADVI